MLSFPSVVVRRRLSLALALPLLSGCSRYVSTHLYRGDEYYKQGKYVDAIKEYIRASRFDADNPRIIRQLGLAYFQVQVVPEAYRYLAKSKALTPNDIPVRLILAKMYLADRRPDDTIKESNAILALDSTNTDALGLMAAAHLDKRQPANATKTLRRLVALAPDNPRNRYLLGIGLLAEGKNDDARKELGIAAGNPNATLDPFAKLIELDVSEHKTDAALARVERQIVVKPTSGRLHYLLGAVHLARGERAAAEKAYLAAITFDPSLVDARVALGTLYANAGELDRGIAQLDGALMLDPWNANAQMMLGVIYQQKGEADEAKFAYEQALSANPRFASAANNLALLLSERFADNRRALQLAEVANREFPDDPHFGDTYGWMLYKSGNYGLALGVLRLAATRLPDKPSIQYHLGMAALQTGDLTLARQALARAVNARQDSPDKDAARKALSSLK